MILVGVDNPAPDITGVVQRSRYITLDPPRVP